MTKLKVYNLQFPDNIFELNIGGYKFIRVSEYEKRFSNLQHTFTQTGGEFSQEQNIGTHQITAEVEIPNKEEHSILPWENKEKNTRLQDIVFLLTIFTERNVFVLLDEKIEPISADSRCHFRGGDTGGFRSFINHDYKHKNKKTGEIVSTINGKLNSDYVYVDIGFEKTLNNVLELINSKKWQDKFNKGFFLFLFQEIMSQIYVTSAFLTCWTICEHLFALHNKKWLDSNAIYKISGESKISFIFDKYVPDYFITKSSEEIKKIVSTRNRLVHYGQIPEGTDLKEMVIFIKITQEIMAVILDLKKYN